MIDAGLRDAALGALVAAGLEPCLLGGPATGGDLDVLVERWREVPAALGACREFRIVQAVRTAPASTTYMLARADDGDLLLLDVGGEIRFGPLLAFSAAEVLATAEARDGVRLPAPDIAFAVYAAKRIHKGDLGRAQMAYLRGLMGRAPGACEQRMARLLGQAGARALTQAVETGRIEGIDELRAAMRDHLRGAPARLAWLRRAFDRLAHPTGFVIAALGPDGAGKTAVLDRLATDLRPAFWRVRRMHLRPGLVHGAHAPGDALDPHGRARRGMIGSVAQALLWLADYALGWVFLVAPARARTTLVLFDRYADDLGVDPRRYRYGGPGWLARFLPRLVPRPDLLLILVADSTVLHGRKPEVAIDEVRRQVTAYRALAERTPGAVLIEADAPFEIVAERARAAALTRLARRSARRLGTPP